MTGNEQGSGGNPPHGSSPPTSVQPAGSAVVSPSEPRSKQEVGEQSHPVVLGEGLPPIPAQVVAQIRKGEFVDMADLLCDNLEAERRCSSHAGASPQQNSPKPLRQEVPDILSWAMYFAVYVAIVAESHPDRVKQLMAYQVMILREAR